LHVPCDANSKPDVNVLIRQAPNFKIVEPDIIKELSQPENICLYYVDINSDPQKKIYQTATTTTNDIDTVATIMVPTNILDKIVSELKGQGFGIDNQYPFKSLRGGGSASGGDKQQELLVLTSSGKNLNEVISALSKIAPTMPYS
jgi:hypothetical protein